MIKCEHCGHAFACEYESDFCPACGRCAVHLWELCRGECGWCFGGVEHCANCRAEVQHHEIYCPEQPNETRPDEYQLIGTIHLKAWRSENRRQPFEVAAANTGIYLSQSNRSGWKYAVWVEPNSPAASLEAARALVDAECSAWAFAKSI